MSNSIVIVISNITIWVIWLAICVFKEMRENIFKWNIENIFKWNVENIYQFCWKFSSACRHAFYLFILREEGFILAKLGSSLPWSGGQGSRGLKKLMSCIHSWEIDGKDWMQTDALRSSSWALAPMWLFRGISKHLLECLTFPPTFYWLCHIHVTLTPPAQPPRILWNWENNVWWFQSTYHHLPKSSVSAWESCGQSLPQTPARKERIWLFPWETIDIAHA